MTAKKSWIKLVAVVVLFSFYSCGCSFLSPINTDDYTKYTLKTLPSPTLKKSRHKIILIAPIETDAVYNTTQMAYTLNPYQVSYFAKNSWAATPAQMLKPLVIQTLQNTHYFQAVISSPPISYYDYILRLQVVELRQEFSARGNSLHLTIQAELINGASHRVISAKQFSVIEPILQSSPYGGAIAANKATARILKQLVGFCLMGY